MAYITIETPHDVNDERFPQRVKSQVEKLKGILIRQTLEDAASWKRVQDEEWARANPEAAGALPRSQWGTAISPEEQHAFESRVRNEYYSWLDTAFDHCSTPSPDASDAPLDTLNQIICQFEGGTGTGKTGATLPADKDIVLIDTVGTEMQSQWAGEFSENFVLKFANPLKTMPAAHALAAKAASEIFGMNKLMYIRYRYRVLELLEKSINAAESLKNGRDSAGSYMFLTLIGISVGTILTLPSMGATGVGVTMIVASTMAQGFAPPATAGGDTHFEKIELGAPTAQEVAQNVSSALTALDGTLYESERSVKDAFYDTYTTISDERSRAISANVDGTFSIPVPSIVNAPASKVTDGRSLTHRS